eukprot:865402-Amorphochlora_amoeboformis.AAC.1
MELYVDMQKRVVDKISYNTQYSIIVFMYKKRLVDAISYNTQYDVVFIHVHDLSQEDIGVSMYTQYGTVFILVHDLLQHPR